MDKILTKHEDTLSVAELLPYGKWGDLSSHVLPSVTIDTVLVDYQINYSNILTVFLCDLRFNYL